MPAWFRRGPRGALWSSFGAFGVDFDTIFDEFGMIWEHFWLLFECNIVVLDACGDLSGQIVWKRLAGTKTWCRKEAIRMVDWPGQLLAKHLAKIHAENLNSNLHTHSQEPPSKERRSRVSVFNKFTSNISNINSKINCRSNSTTNSTIIITNTTTNINYLLYY